MALAARHAPAPSLGVAYAAGTLYVADTYTHKIKRFDLPSGQLHALAGTGAPGQRDGAAGARHSSMSQAVSVGAGRLYVADTNNHQIRVIDLHTQTVSALTHDRAHASHCARGDCS